MNEVLNSDVNEQFKELIIRTLGIITRNKTQKHWKLLLKSIIKMKFGGGFSQKIQFLGYVFGQEN